MKCSRSNPQVDPQVNQVSQGRRLMRSAILLGLVALAACAPSYKSAGVPLPASFREVSDSAPTAVTAVTAGTPPADPPAAAGAPGGQAAPAVGVGYWTPLRGTPPSPPLRGNARPHPHGPSGR